MKSGKIKWFFMSVICASLLIAAWLSVYGINKTIDKTVNVNVFENDGVLNTTSSIKISGNCKKTLFSASFIGTFAMEYYEPSCRDGVQAKIDWQSDNYQNISFYYAGNFSRLDIKKIEIDRDMNHMSIILKDGTIITSSSDYNAYRSGN